jgi:hypothetical protein
MKFGDGVPRWARRRVERHMMRHGDGRIVRWMSFGSGLKPGAVDTVGNVVPFLRRPSHAGPGGHASTLDATGS